MLPPEVQAQHEDPASYFQTGWSRGKEMLEGKADFSKGSYYNNPQYDQPTKDEELIRKCAL